jgi:hypothetical protein
MKTKAKTRRMKQKRTRSRRLSRYSRRLRSTLRGGGDTLDRSIPKEAVMANPIQTNPKENVSIA